MWPQAGGSAASSVPSARLEVLRELEVTRTWDPAPWWGRWLGVSCCLLSPAGTPLCKGPTWTCARGAALTPGREPGPALALPVHCSLLSLLLPVRTPWAPLRAAQPAGTPWRWSRPSARRLQFSRTRSLYLYLLLGTGAACRALVNASPVRTGAECLGAFSAPVRPSCLLFVRCLLLWNPRSF